MFRSFRLACNVPRVRRMNFFFSILCSASARRHGLGIGVNEFSAAAHRIKHTREKKLKQNDLWSPSKPLYKWQWLIWLRFNCISVKVFHVERKRNVAAAALHIILVVFAMKLCNFMWLGLNLWMPWKLWVRLIVLRRRFFQFCKRQPNNPKQIGKKHLYPDDTNYHLLHEWTRAVCRRLLRSRPETRLGQASL